MHHTARQIFLLGNGIPWSASNARSHSREVMLVQRVAPRWVTRLADEKVGVKDTRKVRHWFKHLLTRDLTILVGWRKRLKNWYDFLMTFWSLGTEAFETALLSLISIVFLCFTDFSLCSFWGVGGGVYYVLGGYRTCLLFLSLRLPTSIQFKHLEVCDLIKSRTESENS